MRRKKETIWNTSFVDINPKNYSFFPSVADRKRQMPMRKQERSEEEKEKEIPPLPSANVSFLLGLWFVILLFCTLLSIGGDSPSAIIFVPLFIITCIGVLAYVIINNDKTKYWMRAIRCPQCGYEGEPSWGLVKEKCPRCSYEYVIRLGWRRR